MESSLLATVRQLMHTGRYNYYSRCLIIGHVRKSIILLEALCTLISCRSNWIQL